MYHSKTREVGREAHLIFVGNGAFWGATAQSTTGSITGRGALDEGKGTQELDFVFV